MWLSLDGVMMGGVRCSIGSFLFDDYWIGLDWIGLLINEANQPISEAPSASVVSGGSRDIAEMPITRPTSSKSKGIGTWAHNLVKLECLLG